MQISAMIRRAVRRQGGRSPVPAAVAQLYNGRAMRLCLIPDRAGPSRWTDISGFANHGTMTNSPTIRPGRWNNGVAFNGSTRYADCGTDSSLNLTGAQSGCCWFNPTTLTMANLPILCHKGYNLGSSTSGSWLGWNQEGTGNSSLYVISSASGTNNGAKTSKSWGGGDLRNWYHVAYTWDGSTWRLFVNGSEDTVQVGSAIAPASVSEKYTVGAGNLSDGSIIRYFDGVIGMLQVRAATLTRGEILALYKWERQAFGFY